MRKKKYIIPLIAVELWNMQELMKAAGSSPELPPDPSSGGAPSRTKPF